MSSFFIGQKATISKRFSLSDVTKFSELSTDINPIHLDEMYAKKTIFKKPIVHGFLSSSLISALIANQLPGNISIYLAQELKFLKPVFHDQEIVAEVEITDIKPEKSIYKLATRCYVNSVLVIDGFATI